MAKIKIGSSGLMAEIPVKPQEQPVVGHAKVETPQMSIDDVIQEVMKRPEIANMALKEEKGPAPKEIDIKPLERRIEALEAREPKSEVIETKEIIKPEVKQIIHHKDHNKELEEHSNRISKLNQALQTEKTYVDNKLRQQRILNNILMVGLIVSLVLNVVSL